MARIPIATRQSVPENQRAAFDEVVQRTGSVLQHGPGSVMIHVPEAHRRATQLSNYLRNESSLPQKIQELAMLVTARELNCQHIWNAHAMSGRRAGLSDALVNALRDRHDLPTLPPDEAAVVDYGQELFRTHHIGLVELTMLMGYYGLLAPLTLMPLIQTCFPKERNSSCVYRMWQATTQSDPLQVLNHHCQQHQAMWQQ